MPGPIPSPAFHSWRGGVPRHQKPPAQKPEMGQSHVWAEWQQSQHQARTGTLAESLLCLIKPPDSLQVLIPRDLLPGRVTGHC